MPERIVVVGGNAAGMTAASRAKRLMPDLEVVVLESGPDISYSICGVPYLLSGGVRERNQLLSFTPESLLEKRGIEARTGIEVVEILAGQRRCRCRNVATGEEFSEAFDRLVVATGYRPIVPGIDGTDLRGVYTVSRLEHGMRLQKELKGSSVRRVGIVGGGYVGLMMTHAMRTRGLDVVLVEKKHHVFNQIDDDMSERVEKELKHRGVELHLGCPTRRILGRDGRVVALESASGRHRVDLVVIDVGVRPNSDLAELSGIQLGSSGAIAVDQRGQTSISCIYAAGNCAETRNLVTGRPIFSALGTTASKQGRVVGDNLAGRRTLFSGSLETSVEKVFDLALGRTGLTLEQAHETGFDADAVTITTTDRASYYANSSQVSVRLVFENRSGRVLGAQLVGPDSTAKRIDTMVAAITAQLSLEDLAQLDLAYAPPYATLWDPFQVAANVALKKVCT